MNQTINAGKRIMREKNSISPMEINSRPNDMNDQCGKTNNAEK